MEAATAIRTLELLADGRDPGTGLPLPDASPFNQPLVVRSLFTAIRALEATSVQPASVMGAAGDLLVVSGKAEPDSAPRQSPARGQPANAGKPWTADEDAALCTAFDRGVSIKELAGQHGRSTTALNARLFKLGKIADPGIPLRHPVTPAVGSAGQRSQPASKRRQVHGTAAA